MACGCGSKVCNCAIVAGANVTISGAGSSGNPYVISASGGGGGGGAPVPITIAALNTLATAASLVPGTTYQVTDWVSGTGSLTGPNFLYVEVDDPSTPSKFVRVETPLGILGPSNGEMIWNYASSLTLMTRLIDNFGNDVQDLGFGGIDKFVWGNLAWSGNVLTSALFISTYAQNAAAAAAGFTFTNNQMYAGGNIDLTGATAGTIAGNVCPPDSGGLVVNTGAGPATVSVIGNTIANGGSLSVDVGGAATTNVIEAGGTLTVGAGGSAIDCRASANGTLNTSTFGANGVIVDGGGIVHTMVGNESNTLYNNAVGVPTPVVQSLTIAALVALRNAGTLVPGTTYIVTDWTTTNAFPVSGDQPLVATAISATQLSEFVQVITNLGFHGNLGPNWGLFAWDTPGMLELHDSQGNHVRQDNPAATGIIDSFPWGAPNVQRNIVNNGTWLGVAAAANTFSFQIVENTFHETTLDLGNVTAGGGNISSSRFEGGSVQAGDSLDIQESTFDSSLSVLGLSASQGIAIHRSSVSGVVQILNATAGIFINDSTILGSGSLVQATNVSLLRVLRCTGLNGQYQSTSSGSVGTQYVTDTQNDGLIGFIGTSKGRGVNQSRVQSGSSIVVTESAASSSGIDAVTAVDVVGASTLNVAATGALRNSRVAAAATLNTGAFSSQSVIIDGLFTTTLTAANSNTLKNSLGSNTV